MNVTHIKLIGISTFLYLSVIFVQSLGAFVVGLLSDDTVFIKLGENFFGLIYVLVILHCLRMSKDIYWFSKECLKKWYLFILPLAYVAFNYGDIYKHSAIHIVSAVFSTLFTGAMEEILCRGVVLAIFIKGYKKMGKSNYILKAVIVSSLLFGLAHLSNIIGYGHASGAIIGQVVFATFIAVGFCAVYLRTRSLLPLILIHAGINFMSFLTSAPNAVKTDTFMGTLPAIIVCAPLFIYGVILINKKQSKDLKLQFN